MDQRISLLDLENDWDFVACPVANKYRAKYFQYVQTKASEIGHVIPEDILDLIRMAYNDGFNDGGNFAIKVAVGEV